MKANVTVDPIYQVDFDVIIETCIPLSFVNSINRAMGVLMFIHYYYKGYD
jgi:hypothetical protein